MRERWRQVVSIFKREVLMKIMTKYSKLYGEENTQERGVGRSLKAMYYIWGQEGNIFSISHIYKLSSLF